MKTQYVVECFNGSLWEELYFFNTLEEATTVLKGFRTEEPEAKFRLVKLDREIIE